MTATTLKNKINAAIANVEDEEFLQAVYSLINNKTKSEEFVYSEDLKAELDESSALYKAGKLKTFTMDEVLKKIRKNISK